MRTIVFPNPKLSLRNDIVSHFKNIFEILGLVEKTTTWSHNLLYFVYLYFLVDTLKENLISHRFVAGK